MNGGKETGASLGRNKTAQFSLTECLSNYLTQWKRSQNITAKYLWNTMYNSTGTWHAAWAPHSGLAVFDLTGAENGSGNGTQNWRGRKTVIELQGERNAPAQTKMMRLCIGVELRGSELKHRGSGHLDWGLLKRHPLSNIQLYFTINANIKRILICCSKYSAHTASLKPHNISIQ